MKPSLCPQPQHLPGLGVAALLASAAQSGPSQSQCYSAFSTGPGCYDFCSLLAPPHRRRPFRHQARSPQARTHSFAARPPDSRRLTFDHESFAVAWPLALLGTVPGTP